MVHPLCLQSLDAHGHHPSSWLDKDVVGSYRPCLTWPNSLMVKSISICIHIELPDVGLSVLFCANLRLPYSVMTSVNSGSLECFSILSLSVPTVALSRCPTGAICMQAFQVLLALGTHLT